MSAFWDTVTTFLNTKILFGFLWHQFSLFETRPYYIESCKSQVVVSNHKTLQIVEHITLDSEGKV